LGERQRASLAAPGDLLSVIDHNSAAAGFFRLLTLEPNTVARLGSGGAEVFRRVFESKTSEGGLLRYEAGV